jgi:H+/gluconate symporter-like permease
VDKNEVPVWALVNLILSIVGVILAIILTLYVLLQRNQKQKKQQAQEQIKANQKQNRANQNQKNTNNPEDQTEEQKKKKQRRLFWFLLSVIMGIAGIIVFILTEDMSRPMALVDNWTIVNVIIFIVELIAIVLTFKHNDKDETVVYIVQYYLQGTKNPIVASKTSGFGTIGVGVTEYAPAIVGYVVVGNGVASLTLQEDPTKNEIIFYYTRNANEDKTKL